MTYLNTQASVFPAIKCEVADKMPICIFWKHGIRQGQQRKQQRQCLINITSRITLIHEENSLNFLIQKNSIKVYLCEIGGYFRSVVLKLNNETVFKKSCYT